MSLIDTARAAIRQARGRLHPNRMVFHHVPKCGGTSVGRAIRKRFLLSQATVLAEATYRTEALLDSAADPLTVLRRAEALRERIFLYHMAAGVDCVSAHVRFSDTGHAAYHDVAKFVTILRDPVGRFISHYRWSHGRAHGHAHIAADFDSFLDSAEARHLGAFYVYFFSGLDPSADMTSQDALDRAKANLDKFDVVGFLDRLPAFEAAIRETVGVRVRIGHHNKARTEAPPALHDAATQAKIEALTAPDRAFFAHALDTRR
jgi:hypothetical protein